MNVLVFSSIIINVICEHIIDDSPLMIREKRQNVYYQCGTYPNTYISPFPCSQSQRMTCPNGGRYLNVGCYQSSQCTPYSTEAVTCIGGCCCTSPQQPNLSRFGICPSGQLSEVRCSGRGQCANGQTCMTGLCCTTTGNEYAVACGGLGALSSCSSSGSCSSGGVCTSSNYCCECPVGRASGRCNNNAQCPSGFSCNSNGFCCNSCPGGIMPFGSCQNGRCGGGRTCQAGNICC